MQDLTGKIIAARKAGAALMQLMLKLETDGHILPAGTERPVVLLLPEMIAYVTSQFALEDAEEEQLIRQLVNILPPEEEGTLNGICAGIRKAAEEFRRDPEALPGVYSVLCGFDAMAQEYDGAFYNKMHVDNPGRLSEYYLQLLDAVYEVATDISGMEAADWKERRKHLED